MEKKHLLHNPETQQKGSAPQESIQTEMLDSESEGFEGRISEIAQGNASENGSGTQSSSSKQGDNSSKKDDVRLTERELLRARLLKHAPKAPEMRHEIQAVLEKKKVALERNIHSYSKKKQYDLLGEAFRQLRQLARQMEAVATASYELLREIWLKVVHRFA